LDAGVDVALGSLPRLERSHLLENVLHGLGGCSIDIAADARSVRADRLKRRMLVP